MFERLFAESGLTLDRLRALVEVGRVGSIVGATGGDPVRQSQFSRQIKELEDFFRTRLVERQGKGTRLTQGGKELARISRFFMLGLSNFQRGCLAEEQTFRIGVSATFSSHFLMPLLAESTRRSTGPKYVVEIVPPEIVEQRLHELTLDFAVVSNSALSRPLRTAEVKQWKLQFWAPRKLKLAPHPSSEAIQLSRIAMALPRSELRQLGLSFLNELEPALLCDSFLDVKIAVERGQVAGFLPDFLEVATGGGSLSRFDFPELNDRTFHYYLAWNPRLLRLNPHATRKRDWLLDRLTSNHHQRE